MEIEQIAQFLREHSTLALATVGAECAPHIAPLFYLVDGDCNLYWFSSQTSVHSGNLDRDHRASVTVYSEVEEWRHIRGVQMQGTVAQVEDRTWRKRVATEYVRRFNLGNVFSVALKASTLYVFHPTFIRYIDNSVGFGYKREITCQPKTSG